MKQCCPKQLLLFLMLYIISAKAIAQTYAWKNVKIGAGGYVTGLVFNPALSNLLYHLNCHFEEAARCFSFRHELKILLT
ncbi:hypothetical protein A4D02_33535 [Niastella koreensis]|uniref:Uncharacterized protein n=2 Tax=Niastella koreensis TaxID=354356 RepID=G8TAF1_NIAKG|nr:hypothetical protein Niako_1750 [Niastella koreensis GR20-10]OQP45324.1 hypothetical protein A4D02_33535 [Niastella koreensis]